MLKRFYEPLDAYVQPNVALLIYGPRRVGKTTLLNTYLAGTKLRYRLEHGENSSLYPVFEEQRIEPLLELTEGYDLLAIDEAQMIPNVGMGLKILVDQKPGLHIIATGSSSFELAGQVGEPLTGRKRTLILYPMAQLELNQEINRYDLRQNLEDYLIFGGYPNVLTQPTKQAKIDVLNELTNSYLYKDILAFDRVKHSQSLVTLLRLIAFQVGQEVSATELAGNLGRDVKTVQHYLDLLEQCFVIYRLGGFSRNLREEITRKAKYYFYDNGVRNSLISNFNPLELRNDTGALWENFLMMERLKLRQYTRMPANDYFWRTHQQDEIDLIEERGGNLYAYEFKWSERKRATAPKRFTTAYPEAAFDVITRENYLDFILPERDPTP